MKKILTFILIALSFSQISCLLPPKEKKLDGLWFFTHSTEPTQNENEDANPARFLYLHPDNSYTRDFRKFEHGRWKKNESGLLFTNNQKVTFSYPVKRFTGNELELVSAAGTILNFERLPAKFSTPAENPFSVENNQWRIPATKKENDGELKTRLANHFRFHEAYFKWALDAKLSSIDVRSTPSPIKIYGNGFALKGFDELPAEWLTYFYEEEDCRKASNIIKEIFEKSDITWSQTDNRYKMFISAFQQLRQKVNQ